MSDRDKFLDSEGRPLTQSLFLELGYTPFSIYSLKEYDCEYKGRKYPSIKLLYLEMADPTEYEFANTYFLNWNHWERCVANKAIYQHIEQWRDELEIKLRSQAIKETIKLAKGGSYQANKFLADRGWKTRGAGRPSKEEVAKTQRVNEIVANEYGADIIRLRG